MAISPARTAAFDILLQVEREKAYASELLHSAAYARLAVPDHALATELVMGVLRWRALLDQQIAAHSSQRTGKLDLEVLTSLRLAAYQLGFLNRVPGRAAVHESVELVKRAHKRSAVPFANAVLRKLAAIAFPDALRTVGEATDLIQLAANSAHPQWMVERWERAFGFHAARQICIHNQTIPASALRLDSPDTEAELKKNSIALGGGRILNAARRVLSGNVTKTLAFQQGRIAIQDEASQLVALLVGNGKNILDCCAAPGGKTRMIAGRNPDITVLAAEIHPHRSRLLRKLVQEKNVRVIAADARQLPVKIAFDRVLADVPCSGTGTLAHNPEIKWRLKPEDLPDLRDLQVTILQAAMNHVAPAGRVIYSTCSLEPEENNAVIEAVLAANPQFHLRDCRLELQKLQDAGELAWEDVDSLVSAPFLRTIPGVHLCDGFFAAILQRE